MKLAGFLLLLSGWGIAMLAFAMLPSPAARLGFFGAGLAVEVLGLILAIRSHLPVREDRG